MAHKGEFNLPTFFHASELDPPQLAGAVATAYNKVRVYYNQEMRKTDPGGANDSLNPANYAFTGGLTAVSVALVIPGPTVVEVTVDKEMLQGGAYEVEVSNVQNMYASVIDPLFDTASFNGIGIAPEVSSATAQDEFTVRVVFNEDMKNNMALTTPTNYSFTGGLVAGSVSRINATTVDVTVNEMKQGQAYTVTVSNVEDIAGNTIAGPPLNQAGFSGIGVAPQLLSAAIPVTGEPKSVYVDYTEAVQVTAATNPANYSVFPTIGSGTVTVTQITATRYKVTLWFFPLAATLYTITVTNVPDLAGNPIDPAHDTASWTAVVPSPPFLDFHPGDEVSNIAPRDYLRVQAIDVVPTPSGIDVSTWDIWLEGTLPDGSTFAADVMRNGVTQPGYEVLFLGDADDYTDGIYARFRPTTGYWPEEATLVIYSQVSDNDATSSSDQWTCYIGEFSCFENLLPLPDALDTKLVTGFSAQFPATDQLRGVLMRAATQSVSLQVQARTVLWLSAQTDLRTILARVFDLELVQDIRLCELESIIDIYQTILRNARTVMLAKNEMTRLVGRRTLEPVLQYLTSASPLHVVSAACALVVFAATAGTN